MVTVTVSTWELALPSAGKQLLQYHKPALSCKDWVAGTLLTAPGKPWPVLIFLAPVPQLNELWEGGWPRVLEVLQWVRQQLPSSSARLPGEEK